MSVSTAREALIAELLGDVGLLHDAVKALHPEVARLRTKLAVVVGLAALVGGLAGGAVGAYVVLTHVQGSTAQLQAGKAATANTAR